MAKSTSEKPLRHQPAFKKLKAMLETPVGARNLLWYYEAGKCVEKLFSTEDRLYGQGKMIAIAKALGRPKTFESELNYYRKLVLNYEKSQVRKLSDPRNTKDFPISWTHLKCLLSIEDEEEREKSLQECCKLKMTSRQLRRQIPPTPKHKHRSGKRPVRPKTLELGLRAMNEECESWIRKQREVWFEPKVGVISEHSQPGNRKPMPELLEQAIDNFEQMQRLVGDNLARLKKMRPAIKRKAAAKAKKDTTGRKTPRKVSKKKR